MQITSRDVEILTFINEFGFCTLKQIMQRFQLKQSNGYKIMKRLDNQHLLSHERFYHAKPGVYKLTKNGASFTDLPPLEIVPLSRYDHQLKVIDVFIKLLLYYPAALFLTERRLYKDRSKKDRVNKAHLADGVLILPDKQIAIEVELTLKSKKRLEQIFLAHTGRFDIAEVWYYCNPTLLSILTKLAEKKPFIKVFDLVEFLNE